MRFVSKIHEKKLSIDVGVDWRCIGIDVDHSTIPEVDAEWFPDIDEMQRKRKFVVARMHGALRVRTLIHYSKDTTIFTISLSSLYGT